MLDPRREAAVEGSASEGDRGQGPGALLGVTRAWMGVSGFHRERADLRGFSIPRFISASCPHGLESNGQVAIDARMLAPSEIEHDYPLREALKIPKPNQVPETTSGLAPGRGSS